MNNLAIWHNVMFNRSNNEWFTAFESQRLTILFVTARPVVVQIKHAKRLNEVFSDLPVAASNAPNVIKSKKPPIATCFEDMLLGPKKNKALLKNEKIGAPKVNQDDAGTVTGDKYNKDCSKFSTDSLVKTEFSLKATSATSVKLAADFTGWEKSPVDLVKSENGIWHAVVPLPPGDHSYRYIVDGIWCDDPHSVRRIPNPFGTVNAVVIVTAT